MAVINFSSRYVSYDFSTNFNVTLIKISTNSTLNVMEGFVDDLRQWVDATEAELNGGEEIPVTVSLGAGRSSY